MLDGAWSSLQRAHQKLSALVSVTSNCLLILLILFKSPKRIGAYKYLLISISVYEMFYSFVDFLLLPIFHSIGSTCVIIVVVREHFLSPLVLKLLHSVYIGCFGYCVAIFALHFIYRYLVMSCNQLIKSFDTWKLFLWLSGPLFVGVTTSFDAFFLLGPTQKKTERVSGDIKKVLNLNSSEYTYFVSFFYSDGPNPTIDLWEVAKMTILFIPNTLSLLLVVVFSWKCYECVTSLISLATTSAEHRATQSQLFYALVAQALIPILLMNFPGAVFYIHQLLHWDLGRISDVLSITIALYPAVDPFPTIFIVRSYRRAIFDFIEKLMGKLLRKECASKNHVVPVATLPFSVSAVNSS